MPAAPCVHSGSGMNVPSPGTLPKRAPIQPALASSIRARAGNDVPPDEADTPRIAASFHIAAVLPRVGRDHDRPVEQAAPGRKAGRDQHRFPLTWKRQLDAPECAACGSSDKARGGRRSGPCYDEQRRQAARQLCNRACSALTHWVKAVEDEIVNMHNNLLTPTSGQLPFSGSSRVPKKPARSPNDATKGLIMG